jgi:superfamily II DNA or RNA helicase
MPPCVHHVPVCHLQVTHWRNTQVGSNPEQALAVRSILGGTSGELPFIIWGPPGTGKTVTLVEAAVQV